MEITRRKFLKFLAWTIPTGTIAPAALLKSADAVPPPCGHWVTYDVIKPLGLSPIEGDKALIWHEERLQLETIKKWVVDANHTTKVS